MNIKKLIVSLLLLNVVQLILLISISLFASVELRREIDGLVYGLLAVTCFTAGVTAYGIYVVTLRREAGIKESIKNLEALNSILREQRHDYLNHIQVVYGLLELEEYEEAKNYMTPVFKEILKVSKALKTSQPAVNALLQAKLQMAEKKQIDFYLEIKSNLARLTIEPWELCKVLSNIIDNSIYILEQVKGDRCVYIDISEQPSTYYFNIRNNGPQIPQAQLPKLFHEGFTTKQEEGHGMGLYIVKSIVEKANGTIRVNSDKEQTSFELSLPKAKEGDQTSRGVSSSLKSDIST